MRHTWLTLSIVVASGLACGPQDVDSSVHGSPDTQIDASRIDAQSTSDDGRARSVDDGGHRSARTDDSPSDAQRLPFVRGQQIRWKDAIQPIDEACTSLGAQWEGAECHCPPGTGSFGYKPKGDGGAAQCRSRVTAITELEPLSSSDTDAIERGLHSVGPLSVRIGEGDETMRLELARKTATAMTEAAKASGGRLGGLRETGLAYKRFTNATYTPSAIDHVVVGSPSPADVDLMIRGVLSGPRSADPQGGGVYDFPSLIGFDTGVVEPDPALVPDALGIFGTANRPASLDPLRSQVASGDKERRSAMTALAGAYASQEVHHAFEKDQRFIGYYLLGDSCFQGSCRLFANAIPYAIDGTSYDATVERVYSRGTVIREVFWVQQAGRFVGFVALNPNKGPGLLGVASESVTEEVATMTIDAYDRKWRHLGSTESTWPIDRKTWASSVRRYDAEKTPLNSAMVVCDVGFSRFWEHPIIRDHILMGPYEAKFDSNGRLAAEGGSLFGWTKNPVGSASQFLTGLGLSDWEFIVAPDLRFAQVASDHYVGVGSAALETFDKLRTSGLLDGRSELSFIPMNHERCFDTRLWASARMKNLGVTRVVNASFKLAYEEVKSCINSSDKVVDVATDMLWVVAAGNDYNNAALKEAGCPMRSVRGKRNGLIVAALNSGQALTRSTNYGSDFADIAANGTNPDGTLAAGATSFAAPRVSATAVAIAESFPLLSAAEIRSAILVGSTPRADLRDAVRCGGELNPAGALRVAKCLSETDAARGLLGPRDPFEDDLKMDLLETLRTCAGTVHDLMGDDVNGRMNFLLDERQLLAH
jgi:hypothetical protein